jgi:RNA polymerase sigma factor (sigma-70 family)
VEPWQSELAAGRHQAAWDLVIDRYRRLIMATIRRLVDDDDDGMDVFASVCEALTANELARLKRFDEDSARARFSTWLVAVVRNLTVDWLRKRDGRRRIGVPPALSPLQREIFVAVFLERRSHIEAFELIRARSNGTFTFRAFLRELRETYRLAQLKRDGSNPAPLEPLSDDIASGAIDPADAADAADTARRVTEALAILTPTDRVALELFVIEGLSAADVARALKWPSAKTVYNRAYRSLEALRAELERAGIGLGDAR